MNILTSNLSNTFLAKQGVMIPVSEKRREEVIKVNGRSSSDTELKPINCIIVFMFKNSSLLTRKQVINCNYVNKPSNTKNINLEASL